jgi:hypothetical protein
MLIVVVPLSLLIQKEEGYNPIVNSEELFHFHKNENFDQKRIKYWKAS